MRYLSPLRYPGGKAKLANFVKALFDANDLHGGHYAEPYAGGSSVGLALLFSGHASHIYINDVDPSIHAFWRCVLDQTDDLCRLVRETPLTIAEWDRQHRIHRAKERASRLELGFSTLFLNRTNRSGIIGSGGVIGGRDQCGEWRLDARFNRVELELRISRIAERRASISLSCLDAIDFVAQTATELPERSLTYLDPPYFGRGRRLYASRYEPEDHSAVATVMSAYPHPWIVSYDYTHEVLALYSMYRRKVYSLRYSAAVRASGKEVLVFSDDLTIPERAPITRSRPAVRAD
jgi:DNA adenine methylase